MNISRCKRLIDEAINRFDLDLSGFTILTEAASGNYVLTPLLAALAGAEQVLALTRDSTYATASDVIIETEKLASDWKVASTIQIHTSRYAPQLATADIVTNSGFVRPLDVEFLDRLHERIVIPLMWETWEFRERDLDLAACRHRGIPVLGTNEESAQLQTQDYLGHVAMRLLFSLDIEVFRSRIAVLGSGSFSEQVCETLKLAGAEVESFCTTDWTSAMSESNGHFLRFADALVVVEHESRAPLIGLGTAVTANNLLRINPGLAIAHLCGSVDRDTLASAGLRCAPSIFRPVGYMSVATDYVGPRPLIDLHAAGLKVGQSMAEARRAGLNGRQAELAVLDKLVLAQGFAGYHSVAPAKPAKMSVLD
ncbi:MAG: hypothetical protein IH991_13690 [Planctomycetes bacterium]|nr:hypothetical protein [Planctomycetota bacterium]